MGKLHELLAIEADKKKAAERLTNESIKTFKKDNLFTGTLKRTEMFDDEAEPFPDEHLKLETTVEENLDYSLKALIKYWNAVAQKDATNANAKADVIVRGKTILKDVPGVTLLGMEKKLHELKNLFNAIPTLKPGITWEPDTDNEKDGIYKAKYDSQTFKTKTELEFPEVSPATERHPAQIKEVSVTRNIGKYTTSSWSGMVTPHKKAKWITNLEDLLSGVKKARQRSNDQETVDIEIGQALIDFILE